MTTIQRARTVPTVSAERSEAASMVGPMAWLLAAAGLFFLVPWLGTDRVGLQSDTYYLAYFTLAVCFFGLFARTYARPLVSFWRRNRWRSLAVGAAVGGVMLVPLFRQDGTTHPDGWRYGFELVWRGVVYGTVDALTLFVLPAAVAYLVLGGIRRGKGRKAAFAALSLLLSMFVTVTYHLGYVEYRGDTMRFPALGALVANAPTALTGNPTGAVAAHVTMHVGAVVHQREGGQAHMLPPKVTTTYPNHGSGDAAAALAVGWLAATAAALVLVRRTRRSV